MVYDAIIEKNLRVPYKKLLRSPENYTIIGIKPGRETPTKARLTSLKTPEATFPAPLKKENSPKENRASKHRKQ